MKARLAAAAILLISSAPMAVGQVPVPKPTPPTAGPASLPVHRGVQEFSLGAIGSFVPDGFTLAAIADELDFQTVIPPCNEGFGYCIYYSASTYVGTNFEAAGLRINQRDDLATEEACLSEQPAGYTGLVPSITDGGTYRVATFAGIGDAGAGHFSEGTLFRLAWQGECYELETRIAQTQFANYDPGTIRQFTQEDAATINAGFQSLLDRIRLRSATPVTFPPLG